jgi:transcriptional regulator with XRE-family HTH domain
MGLSQAEAAKLISKSRVVISNYESGRAAPEPDQAVLLAKKLREDPSEFVLLAALQRGLLGPDTDMHNDLLHAIDRLRGRIGGRDPVEQKHQAGLPGYLSLADGIRAFSPMVVFVGDKREAEPQSAGDLFVFSASTVDDRWLLSLGLASDTEKISDKVLMTARPEWLSKQFGHKNIMSIGSPASNLFSRQFNDHFLFRFAINRTTQNKWGETHKRMLGLDTPARLLQFYDESKADLKQTMRMFKPPGFVDFNYPYLTLGMDLSYGKDFAVISVGTNPFSEPGSPYFAILVAGVHHPGTAHAVRFLSDTSNFVKHPFGGVLEVEVPSKKCDPREISWHNKIENCHAAWHTAGHEALEHDLPTTRANLTKWLGQLEGMAKVIDIALEKEEIERHLRLLDALVAAKKGGADEVGEATGPTPA